MSYRVQEIFATLQGEGAQSGRAAVFLRFAGCNLWNGDPSTRATATCRFCDTDFTSLSGPRAGVYPDARSLAETVRSVWTGTGGTPLVVCTGGEPTLQMDARLVDALHREGFSIAMETNGTQAVLPGVDWITVSPKAGARWVQRSGQELKVVWPQPFELAELETLDFGHFFLQPMDDADPVRAASNREATVAACLVRPAWRLSFQTHKALGIA
ncbi:MAG TPA: 7-carboxy-7-deazaguanine synthase [Fibrobacteria bacterium]|nr:7-carboxy-7-deazaguanine synthase [Fibrobacteria bacterium]HOX50508.1 7-carboxy-7-deazaguanine synthase [Fibrobacteria bacterium]